jgi:predicted Zn finger-like uncharacterized protein
MMAKLPEMRFDCPTCHARYKVVRAEVDALYADRDISCRHCGAPLQGRDGDFFLKYFLVERRPRPPSQ